MLAHVERSGKVPVLLVRALNVLRALLHQLSAILFRLFPSHKPVNHPADRVKQLPRKLGKMRCGLCGAFSYGLRDPLALLRCDSACGGYLARRVAQEEGEDLAVTGFGLIGKAKWCNTVLLRY
jgi:hypothetical protein